MLTTTSDPCPNGSIASSGAIAALKTQTLQYAVLTEPAASQECSALRRYTATQKRQRYNQYRCLATTSSEGLEAELYASRNIATHDVIVRVGILRKGRIAVEQIVDIRKQGE